MTNKDKIKELYNQGYTHREIAEMLNTTRDNITKHIKVMRNNGEIEERAQAEVKRKKIEPYAKHEYDAELIEMYNQGLLYTEIAEKLKKVSYSYISKRIRELMEEGKIIKRPFKRKKVENYVSEHDVHYNIGEIVKCDYKRAKTCIWGCCGANPTSSKCRFMACTGKSRNQLLPKEYRHVPHYRLDIVDEENNVDDKENYVYCNVYEQKTRENRMRKCLGDTIGGAINDRKRQRVDRESV